MNKALKSILKTNGTPTLTCVRLAKGLIVPLVAAGALLSGGCAALLVGGAAAGGYVVGKDERPVGTQVDDGTITASVKTKLLADKYAPGWRIDVDTSRGVVTLNGRVKSYVARTQAEKLARETNGVVEVINKLDVIDPED